MYYSNPAQQISTITKHVAQLDADHKAGRVNSADYQAQRDQFAQWLRQAVAGGVK